MASISRVLLSGISVERIHCICDDEIYVIRLRQLNFFLSKKQGAFTYVCIVCMHKKSWQYIMFYLYFPCEFARHEKRTDIKCYPSPYEMSTEIEIIVYIL